MSRLRHLFFTILLPPFHFFSSTNTFLPLSVQNETNSISRPRPWRPLPYIHVGPSWVDPCNSSRRSGLCCLSEHILHLALLRQMLNATVHRYDGMMVWCLGLGKNTQFPCVHVYCVSCKILSTCNRAERDDLGYHFPVFAYCSSFQVHCPVQSA